MASAERASLGPNFWSCDQPRLAFPLADLYRTRHRGGDWPRSRGRRFSNAIAASNVNCEFAESEPKKPVSGHRRRALYLPTGRSAEAARRHAAWAPPTSDNIELILLV